MEIPYTAVWQARTVYGLLDQMGGISFPHAVVNVHLEKQDGTWAPLKMELDTGADLTVLPRRYVEQLKPYSEKRPIIMKQVAGQVLAYVMDAKVSVMEVSYITPVLALDGNPTPLLGRTGLLDHFKVTMTKNGFELTPYY